MEIDLSNLPPAVRQKMDHIFRHDFDLKVLKAIERQTATAKARENGLPWRDDMRPQFEIDPMVDSIWRQFYGHNYTENVDLMKFLVARNPEIVVKSRSGKTMVGYSAANRQSAIGNRQSKRAVRFAPNTLQLAK
jgi:hypothetical protein